MVVSADVVGGVVAPVLYETHMHTPLCGHASGLPEEYAKVAVERGLKGIIVTDHNPMPLGYAPTSRMTLGQLSFYQELVKRARALMVGVADVRLGLECDFAPGMEDWLRRSFAGLPLDYVLGSVHPKLESYRVQFWTGDVRAYQRLYFEHLALAAETGLFDALAHPDLVKNVSPGAWRPHELLDDIARALDRIAATGCALELNTSGLGKEVSEMNPGLEILKIAREREIPVVVGADAHSPGRVGENFGLALATLEEAGYDAVSLILNHERTDIPIEVAKASLK